MAAKEPIDRRINDNEVHDRILARLSDNSDKLIVINERQQLVLKRLDTINGTVADYNANKYKIDESLKKVNCLEIESVAAIKEIAAKVITHEADTVAKELKHLAAHISQSKEYDSKFVSVKVIATMSTILGLLIIISTLLNVFGIRLGA